MAKYIGGFDDLPGDSRPPESIGGVSAATYDELKTAIADYYASVAILQSRINDAQQARVALLNWIALGEKLVAILMPILQQFVAATPSTGSSTNAKTRIQDILGLMGVGTDSKEGTILSILGVIKGLLK